MMTMMMAVVNDDDGDDNDDDDGGDNGGSLENNNDDDNADDFDANHLFQRMSFTDFAQLGSLQAKQLQTCVVTNEIMTYSKMQYVRQLYVSVTCDFFEAFVPQVVQDLAEAEPT